MIRIMLILCITLFLTACNQMRDISKEVSDLGNDITRFGQDVSAILNGQPTSDKQPANKPAATSYCYKAQADVLCYNSPLPGQEFRMVGYQTNRNLDNNMRSAIAARHDNYMQAPFVPVSVQPVTAISNSTSAQNFIDESSPRKENYSTSGAESDNNISAANKPLPLF